jgi:hypothetical protein
LLSGMAHLGMDQLGYLFPLCFTKKVLPIYGGWWVQGTRIFQELGGIGDIDRAQLGSSIIYSEVIS